MSDVVSFENASCRIGSAELVRDLNLSISEGETFVLLGRSGSGKTTTLKLVNRLLPAASGSVIVEGRNVAEWDPILLRRRIGYVIQDIGLFPHFTIERNVGLVPSLLNWDPAKIKERYRSVMQLVDLDPDGFAARLPFQLSGGQRQRAGVARALAADPPLLLMDEPFGALDPVTRTDLQAAFKSWKKRLGKTILFVTHDVAEAFLLGDRIGLMESGRLVECGPKAVMNDSDHPLIQAFRVSVENFLKETENPSESL